MSIALRYIEVVMTHISRQFLKGEAEKQLGFAMIGLLCVQGSASRRQKVSKELLTGVEKLMLAKRLAIICMLVEGVTYEEIAKTLKVSSSTVARLQNNLEHGKYKEISKALHSNKTSTKLLKLVESLILPKQRYAPRWKFIDDL